MAIHHWARRGAPPSLPPCTKLIANRKKTLSSRQKPERSRSKVGSTSAEPMHAPWPAERKNQVAPLLAHGSEGERCARPRCSAIAKTDGSDHAGPAAVGVNQLRFDLTSRIARPARRGWNGPPRSPTAPGERTPPGVSDRSHSLGRDEQPREVSASSLTLMSLASFNRLATACAEPPQGDGL